MENFEPPYGVQGVQGSTLALPTPSLISSWPTAATLVKARITLSM